MSLQSHSLDEGSGKTSCDGLANKQYMFSHFCTGLEIGTNCLKFLNLDEISNFSKKFYNIDY